MEELEKTNYLDPIYFETSELIHKYYQTLSDASTRVFAPWHRG